MVPVTRGRPVLLQKLGAAATESLPVPVTGSRHGQLVPVTEFHSPRESYIILESKESSPSPYPRRVIHSRDDGAQVGDSRLGIDH